MKKLITILAMVMLSSAAFGSLLDISFDDSRSGQITSAQTLDWSASYLNIDKGSGGPISVNIKGWQGAPTWAPIDLTGTIMSIDVRFNVAQTPVGDPLPVGNIFDVWVFQNTTNPVPNQESIGKFLSNPPAGNSGEWITLSWDIGSPDAQIGTFAASRIFRIALNPNIQGHRYTQGDTLDVRNLRFDAIPEPGTMALMGFGLLTLLGIRRKK